MKSVITDQKQGPTEAGEYLVTRKSAGSNAVTIVQVCRNEAQADEEIKRLNAILSRQEKLAAGQVDHAGFCRARFKDDRE